jgi:hypothetical protein
MFLPWILTKFSFDLSKIEAGKLEYKSKITDFVDAD